MAFSTAAAGGSRLPLAVRICMRPCCWREQSNCCCCCFGTPERVRKERVPLWKGKPPPHAGGIPLLFWQSDKKKKRRAFAESPLRIDPHPQPFPQPPVLSHTSLSSTSFPAGVDLLRHLCEEPGQRDCRAQWTGESSRARLQHVCVARVDAEEECGREREEEEEVTEEEGATGNGSARRQGGVTAAQS